MRLNPLLPPLRPRLRAAACGLLLALGQAQAADCAALAEVATADARVDRAAHVAAPATVEGVAVSAAFCRVQGTARPSADSLIRFEVWLPLDGARWSGRLKVNGTGGFAGAVPYARLAQDVADGFVGAGSNMGHDGGESPAWTLNRPEKVKDWGLRAHQSVTLAARTLALAHFGRPVRHAYFEGCSNGGRQALLMAQQYPQLFDGIVAGAPSNFYPDLLMWLLWSGQALMPSAPPAAPVVSAEQRQHVTRRVLQACDAADGLADGQITDPRACQFDIRTLGPQGDGSLSAPALAAFQAMYAGTTSPAGERRYTGARPGSEADWDPLFADRGGYGAFIGHAVYGRSSPPFDWRRELDFGPVHDHVKATLSPVTAAPSPDLRAFRQRGGKIIQYHGWNDAVVPPDGSIGYLHALAQFERLQALPAAELERRIDRLNLRQLAATSARFGPRVRPFTQWASSDVVMLASQIAPQWAPASLSPIRVCGCSVASYVIERSPYA